MKGAYVWVITYHWQRRSHQQLLDIHIQMAHNYCWWVNTRTLLKLSVGWESLHHLINKKLWWCIYVQDAKMTAWISLTKLALELRLQPRYVICYGFESPTLLLTTTKTTLYYSLTSVLSLYINLSSLWRWRWQQPSLSYRRSFRSFPALFPKLGNASN